MEKVNKSPKDTPTKSKKNNKDAVKKRDENTKDEKQDTITYTNASSANKEAMREILREVKELKEMPIKEVKEVVKEVVQQLPNKEPKKTKKKNDILSQIGKSLFVKRYNLLVCAISTSIINDKSINLTLEDTNLYMFLTESKSIFLTCYDIL